MACGTPVFVTPPEAVTDLIEHGWAASRLRDSGPQSIAEGILGDLNCADLDRIASDARVTSYCGGSALGVRSMGIERRLRCLHTKADMCTSERASFS
jgi:hypothetical protein